ncbi:MAG: phage portal protein [Firmicutes bacterium]|nr:phage portal protein [Bacillota bacterium]
MITSGFIPYEVVLRNQYYLREIVDSITLEDSLDEVAYRAVIGMAVTSDFPGIAPGDEIRVSGQPFAGTGMVHLLHPGVVWDCESTDEGQKRLLVTAYDRSIHLLKSEDEYFFPAGKTATQRIRKYAEDWNVTLGVLEDTGVQLAKAVHRAQKLIKMIQADLKETVDKGGEMYQVRVTPDGLQLIKLGVNETVWMLEADNMMKVVQRRTLEGTVTQVKALGNAGGESRSPVLAVVKGETDRFGTLQKVLIDQKVTNAGEAKKAGEKLLSGIQESFVADAIDINTIRAGDKMMLNGMELLVTSVRHELGSPGRMSLELGSEDYVRRRYYAK